MKCKNCGSKIKDNDIYCPECGTSTKESCLTKIGKSIYKNRITIYIVLIVLIVLIATFNLISYLFGPEYVARKYINSLSKNNYNEIYELLDVNESSLVNKKILKEKMTKINIDAYKLDTVNIYGGEALITFKYEDNNEINYVSVLLRNSMIKKCLFFDNWKIMSSKVATNVKIKVPKNSTVTLDNIDIKEFKTENDNYDIYEIDEMFTGNYEIKIELENGLKVEDKIDITSNKTYTIGNIDLEEEIKNNLEDQLLTAFNTLYSNAINKVAYNDTGLINLKEEYQYLKNALQNKYYNLTNISFSDISVNKATYGTNLEVTFDLTCNYTVNYTNGDETKTYNGIGSTTINANYNVSDNNYTLDSIKNLPISFRIR